MPPPRYFAGRELGIFSYAFGIGCIALFISAGIPALERGWYPTAEKLRQNRIAKIRAKERAMQLDDAGH